MNAPSRINNLRAQRLLRGLSQRQIAEKTGLKQMWISRLEMGGSATVTEDRAKRIAAVLDVPVEELFQKVEEE